MKQFLAESVFWRCQFLRADALRVEAEAKLAVARALDRYHTSLRAAGLDPSQAYTWSADQFVVETPDPPTS